MLRLWVWHARLLRRRRSTSSGISRGKVRRCAMRFGSSGSGWLQVKGDGPCTGLLLRCAAKPAAYVRCCMMVTLLWVHPLCS